MNVAKHMANQNVRYDYTKNKLTPRMIVLGICLILAGIALGSMSYETYSFVMSLVDAPHEGETALYVCGMALSAALIALGAIVLFVPKRPALGGLASVMSIAITVACIAVAVFFMRSGDAGETEVFVTFAMAGVLCWCVIR